MATAQKRTSSKLGSTIKRLRQKNKMSLEELAGQTGLDPDYLTKVEEEEEIPHVGAILQISQALSLDASTLLTQAEEKERTKKKKESFQKRKRSYAYKTLSPGTAAMHLKAFQVTIDPKQDHAMVEYRHEGEEFVYVLKGKLEVTVGDKIHKLSPGKSLHFNSSVPHMLRNPGSDKSELIVVLYTP